MIARLFLFMWLFGIPLTSAVLLLHARSQALAWGVALVCAPLSVGAFFLSVPLPSFANTLLGAVPAWLVVAVVGVECAVRGTIKAIRQR